MLLLSNMAKDAKNFGSNSYCKNKTIKKLMSKNFNKTISYLISNAKVAFI